VHRRVAALCSVLVLLSFLFAGAVAKAAPRAAKAKPLAEPTAWTSYANDNQLRNSVFSKSLTRQSVRRLTPSWTVRLDGTIYASPLSLKVGGRQLLYVATEAGSVYALSAANGAIVWQKELGTTVTQDCGTWGITSTGVIDATRALLFVIGATGSLHALDLSTGAESEGYPRQLVSQTGYEYVWGGLRIAAGRIYIPVASYCDVGPPDGAFPEGRLVSIPLDHSNTAEIWDPVPGPGNLGGIWGWGGVSVDPLDGSIYTAVGNSHVWSEECSCYVGDAGYGNHVVHLAADLSSVIDSQVPSIPAVGDYDFGAAPLLFQPKGCPPLAAANNKVGTLFIWDRRHLEAGPLISVPLGDGLSAFIGRRHGRRHGKRSTPPRQCFSVTEAGSGTACGLSGLLPAAASSRSGQRHWATGIRRRRWWLGTLSSRLVAARAAFLRSTQGMGPRLWSIPTVGRTVAAMITVGGALFGVDAQGSVYAFRPARG
jgi:hypothetical protein